MRTGIVVSVTPKDRVRLEEIVADGNTPQKHAKRARVILATADEPMFAPDEEPRADDTLERKERDAKIRTAFEALPPNQHEVVALHFFEDEPHSAIAKRLGLPLGTVKSRLRLAFEKIRRELGDL